MESFDDNIYEWEDVMGKTYQRILDDEVYMAYTKSLNDKSKYPLLIVKFGIEIAKHLGVKPKDGLLLKHDKLNWRNFLMLKAANGYKIAQFQKSTSQQICFRYPPPKEMPLFKVVQCKIFLNENKTVRLLLPPSTRNNIY